MGTAKTRTDHGRVVPITIGIAVALVLVVVVSPHPPGGSSAVIQPPGYAFRQAATVAQDTANNASGGPWRLIAVNGIVSTAPVTPITVEYPPGTCQYLPGPTVWNGSGIPTWTGSLSSGVSPFWSLIFVNATGYLLPVETVNESVHVDPSISPSSACGRGLAGIGAGVTLVNATTVNPVLDSTTAAGIAWSSQGVQFLRHNGAAAIYYEAGLSPIVGISNPSGGGWGVMYTVCSLPGFAHDQADAEVNVLNESGPPEVSNGTVSCTLSRYNVSLIPDGTLPGPVMGEFVALSLNLSSVCTVCAPAPIYNPSGLATWLVNANLTNDSRTPQTLANVSCSLGAWGESTCTPSTAGWFVALTSPTGYWLDIFDSRNGTPGWVLPNVPMFTNDTLTVYLPHFLVDVSVNLTLSSTYPSVPVVGSQVF